MGLKIEAKSITNRWCTAFPLFKPYLTTVYIQDSRKIYWKLCIEITEIIIVIQKENKFTKNIHYQSISSFLDRTAQWILISRVSLGIVLSRRILLFRLNNYDPLLNSTSSYFASVVLKSVLLSEYTALNFNSISY